MDTGRRIDELSYTDCVYHDVNDSAIFQANEG